jgi:thioredoxin 1
MSVKEISSMAEFRTLVSSTTFVALEAYATWVGPCRIMGPLFKKHADDLAIPGKYVFARFDVDLVSEIAQEVGVRAMPTFIFFDNGEKVKDLVGASPPALQAAVGELSSQARA